MRTRLVTWIIPCAYLIALFFLYFFLSFGKKYDVFPAASNIGVYPSSDEAVGGKSKMNSFIIDSNQVTASYNFNLSNVSYVGATFMFNGEKKDLNDYNQIEINLSTKNVRTLSLNFLTYEEGISKVGELSSYRVNRIFLNIDSSESTASYKLNYGDFETPVWWVNNNTPANFNLGETDWSKVKSISLLHVKSFDLGNPSSIKIESVKVVKSGFWFVLYALVFLCVYYVVVWVVLWLRKWKNSQVVMPFRGLEIEKVDFDGWKAELVRYIGENYQNSELSITDLVKFSGKNQKIISAFLQDEFGMTFKQYLNQIRMEESKHLLRNSTLSVKEVAYAVGYGTANHFTRVFKETEGVPPTEYRDMPVREYKGSKSPYEIKKEVNA